MFVEVSPDGNSIMFYCQWGTRGGWFGYDEKYLRKNYVRFLVSSIKIFFNVPDTQSFKFNFSNLYTKQKFIHKYPNFSHKKAWNFHTNFSLQELNFVVENDEGGSLFEIDGITI